MGRISEEAQVEAWARRPDVFVLEKKSVQDEYKDRVYARAAELYDEEFSDDEGELEESDDDLMDL